MRQWRDIEFEPEVRIFIDTRMSGKIAIISGTSIARSRVFQGWKSKEVKTPYGDVVFRLSGDVIVVNRHGFENPLPPHAINYRAYVDALKKLKVENAICLSSVGSLKESLGPGSFVSCEDYVSFAPMTFFDDELSGFAPVVDNSLLKWIRSVSPHPIKTGKIYAQTRGPRFETKAEVKILQSWGCDVVGMTFANEADLLLEKEIGITSLCMIDNLAHGLGRQQLSLEDFRAMVSANQAKVDNLLDILVQELRS